MLRMASDADVHGDILLLPCHQARSLGSFTRTSPVRSYCIRPEPESIRQSGKKSGLTVFSPVRMLQNGSTTRARQVL